MKFILTYLIVSLETALSQLADLKHTGDKGLASYQLVESKTCEFYYLNKVYDIAEVNVPKCLNQRRNSSCH